MDGLFIRLSVQVRLMRHIYLILAHTPNYAKGVEGKRVYEP